MHVPEINTYKYNNHLHYYYMPEIQIFHVLKMTRHPPLLILKARLNQDKIHFFTLMPIKRSVFN